MKTNYQIILNNELELIKSKKNKPSLLLHSCCAPCSGYVLEYLYEYFHITLFYYNPNISPAEEYEYRKNELHSLVKKMNMSDINIISPTYDYSDFSDAVKGYEYEKEGGARCFLCYNLRLKKSIDYAEANGYDYVTTTLTISPHKNARVINEIGLGLTRDKNVKYLLSDFKKNNGYKRSCELSLKYDLYRQNYCGCMYSKT